MKLFFFFNIIKKQILIHLLDLKYRVKFFLSPLASGMSLIMTIPSIGRVFDKHTKHCKPEFSFTLRLSVLPGSAGTNSKGLVLVIF